MRDTWSAGVYWFNQNVLDGVVNGAAAVARGGSGVVMWFDRNVIDFVVNGAGAAMETFGKGLRTIQSGKVQWYAVGLFAGVIALTPLRLQVRDEGRMNETTWQQWAITITTFLPIVGAIVVLLVPTSKDRMIRGLGVVTTALAFVARGGDRDRLRLRAQRRAAVRAERRSGSRRSAPDTTWGSTASRCRCSC